MITTCAACRTAFRVTEEQLDARDGRVRCGRCATIFDARDSLRPETWESLAESPHAATPTARPAQTVAPELAPIPLLADATPQATDGTSERSVRAPEDAAPAATVAAPARATERPFAKTSADEPLFPSTELRPRRQLFWGLGSSLLVLLLTSQIAFHDRGEIALLFPEVRPAIAELCSSLSCSMPLPRRSELMSIESSDLQADPANPSVMVLTATLRNRAEFAQSHPALELTLTDIQDQPLARRVLGVRDYLGRGTSVEAGFPGNSELPVKIYVEASSLKATGYRLYLFYP